MNNINLQRGTTGNRQPKQMYGIRSGLGHFHPNVVNFFQQNTLEILSRFSFAKMSRIESSFLGVYPQILEQLNAERDVARERYLSNRPANITQEQMLQNINGLYAPMIDHAIEYSQKAIGQLNIPAEKVYGQRFDKRRFNAVRNQISDAYAVGATTGLLTELAAAGLVQEFPEDLNHEIASFLSRREVGVLAQTSQSTRQLAIASAREAFLRLNQNNNE
jgi:hypothetical protein